MLCEWTKSEISGAICRVCGWARLWFDTPLREMAETARERHPGPHCGTSLGRRGQSGWTSRLTKYGCWTQVTFPK
jgi:hypothetical protein